MEQNPTIRFSFEGSNNIISAPTNVIKSSTSRDRVQVHEPLSIASKTIIRKEELGINEKKDIVPILPLDLKSNQPIGINHKENFEAKKILFHDMVSKSLPSLQFARSHELNVQNGESTKGGEKRKLVDSVDEEKDIETIVKKRSTGRPVLKRKNVVLI